MASAYRLAPSGILLNSNPTSGEPILERARPRMRSFVRRQGRITPAQQRALQVLWPKFGVDVCDVSLNLDALFGRSASTTLEIGFGNGAALVKMALHEPQKNFLGIDVYQPGIGSLLLGLEKHHLDNVKVVQGDAYDLLSHHLADASLNRVLILFPDPWPKKRHHKRRLVQTAFIELIADTLKPQGILHIATDWQDYADHINATLEQSTCFTRSQQPDSIRQATKYERRGQNLGHHVWDFIYQKVL